MRTRRGETVQLGNIARIVYDTGPTQIDHQARQRQITVLANLEGKPLGTAVQDVNAITERIGLPEGFEVDFEGMAQIMGEIFPEPRLRFVSRRDLDLHGAGVAVRELRPSFYHHALASHVGHRCHRGVAPHRLHAEHLSP